MSEIHELVKEKLGNKIVRFEKKNDRRYYVEISAGDIIECTTILFRELGMRFAIATAIDTRYWFEVLYHFSHDNTGKIFTLRVLLRDKSKPEIESITSVVKGAEWIEREMWELMGINFKNHPNLKRLLLAPDWPEGKYPLRVDSENVNK
ncbi:MAG: NADH-quinone oxidoreductase subunit C [Elusimicrobiota bacterium]